MYAIGDFEDRSFIQEYNITHDTWKMVNIPVADKWARGVFAATLVIP
jgi:hypothetical protein